MTRRSMLPFCAPVAVRNAVEVREVAGSRLHVFELTFAKEDLGKVIGKGGANASAIRMILSAASGKERKRYILQIIED